MSRSFLVLVLSTLAVVAGCVAPANDTETASADAAGDGSWWQRAIPSIETRLPDGTPIDAASFSEHDHNDRAQHANLSTPDFEVLGYDPLVTAHYGTTLTGMGCGGAVTREDGRKLAIVHSIATDVSFVVADVTDPAAPVMMGEYYMPNAVVWDADISADGNHVLVGAYPYAIFGSPVPVLPPGFGHGPALAAQLPASMPDLVIKYRDACTGEVRDVGPESYFPFGPGIVMVGIQDPANPTFEDWKPQPAIGPHSVGSQLIDGTLWATASVTNLNHEGSYYSFFEIVDTPLGGKLVQRAHIEAPGMRSSTSNMGLDNGHIDVFLQKHPVTGATLAYLANWNDGLRIYDMSLPVPTEVAHWADGDAGSVHTTYPFPVMWGDKHYLLVGQEVGEPEELPSGWVYILDITDPASPTEVGRWTLPIKPTWGTGAGDGGLMFSPHYVSVLDTTMFVSNYHGGLWAVDINDPSMPQAVGIFVPDRDSPAPYADGAYGPGIEDVIVDYETGTLTTWDAAGGVYLLRYDATKAMPPAPAWPHEDGHGHDDA